MIETRTLTVPRPALAAEKLGFFRYTHVAGRVVLTNDAGEWHHVSEPEFRDLLAARVQVGHPQYEALLRKGFLRDALDVDALADRIRRKRSFLRHGPHLHIVITTLRCNQTWIGSTPTCRSRPRRRSSITR
jgi:hypothetical protein